MKEKETFHSLMRKKEDKETNCESSNEDLSQRKWYSIDTSMIVPKWHLHAVLQHSHVLRDIFY